MDLILWRHADAGHPLTGSADLQRPLSPKGRKQAHRMARWLDRLLPSEVRILSSPARRTQETAAALGRSFMLEPAVGPEAGVEDLLAAVGWPGASRAVLVVGHQPTLGAVAARLLADVPQTWTVKKGAVWWLRSRVGLDDGQAILRAVSLPEDV